MSAEAEELVKQVQNTRNFTDSRGRILNKQTRYLTARERTTRTDELKFLDGTLNQPAWMSKGMTGDQRRTLTNRRNHIEDDLKQNAPPTDLSGMTRDALSKLEKQLREEWLRGMPTAEVMRRNPAGAVDKNMRWQTANKDRIMAWKNTMRLLEPDNDEKDYTNIERFRSQGITQDMAATYMMSGQIPGNFAMTELAKANWPENMREYGTVDSVLRQAERGEIAEQAAEIHGIVDPEEIDALKAEIKQLQQQLDTKDIVVELKDVEPKQRTETPWTCTECAETMTTRQKGAHIIKHKREAKAQATLQS